MKTQLLEDIGQSAASPLTISRAKRKSTAGEGAPVPGAPVSMEKPLSVAQAPERQASPPELHGVLEEIAALEAQYVPPAPHAPAVEPALHGPAPVSFDAPDRPAALPAEPTLDPQPRPGAATPPDPLFDFTPPSPQPADVTPAPSWPARSRPRYLVYAVFLVSGALLIQGGRWLVQERKDAGTLALVAGEAKDAARVNQASEGRTSPAKALVSDTAAAPAKPPPPLVLLEPDPQAAGETVRSTDAATDGAARESRDVAEATPPPKPARRVAREGSERAVKPAVERRERDPSRQLARVSASGTNNAPEQDTSLSATLRACRERGYHATQCIKRACSMTKYGFACRGR